ncbi:MAG: DUF4388 domain-containing protein [Verrucomicrobiota bacterium]|nr:DUF4388 domain-containing protein [Verrucomicrobiota bacterium]
MSDQFVKASELVHSAKFIQSHTPIKDVAEFFKQSPLHYLAITENNGITGLISKALILSQVGARYGWALYADKPVSEIMNRNPLVVDGASDGVEVLRHVAQRGEADFYDDIIVSQDGVFAGLISVKDLIMAELDSLEKQLVQATRQRQILEQTISAHLLDQSPNEEMMHEKVQAIVETAYELATAEQTTGDDMQFQGQLGMFSSIDLVQLLVQGNKTGILILKAGSRNESQSFKIFFNNGQIIHSEGAGDSGHEALWKALRLTTGEFRFEFSSACPVKTISDNPMQLLLEACKRQDHETSDLPV